MGAIYLLISFISYLSSWKADQDKVLALSWRILFKSGSEVNNWLGRLGALSSHFFFYYGFGIACFLIIPVIIHLGFRFLKRSGWLGLLRYSTHTLMIMALLSMILDFIFQDKGFPYGGSFGGRTNDLLSNFVGEVGLGVTLIFSLISFIIWFLIPVFKNYSFKLLVGQRQTVFWIGQMHLSGTILPAQIRKII